MSALHLVAVLAMAQFAQARTGELRLTLTDASALPLVAEVELVSEANQVRERLQTDATGALVVRRLPFGAYQLTASRSGFATFVGRVEIRSALPTDYRVTLTLAPVQASVTVGPEETLLDPRRTTSEQRIGAETIRTRMTAFPGRSLPDLVNTQPGWLLEANGILHPRGSEYQTQYVIDGLPLTDNRSPAFAPEIDADAVRTMNVLTGGYPAEYGRKLGGVIEVVTAGEARRGLHGSASGTFASDATRSGEAVLGHTSPRMSLGLAAGLSGTNRYLDPPVEENFTNHGTTSNVSLHVERDLTSVDRLGVILRRGESRFLVPNERVQQDAGQRQRRNSREISGRFSFQRLFSSAALADVRAMARDLTATLDSNAVSTPIVARQNRGLSDLYLKGAVLLHRGSHEWKIGGDVIAGSVREGFSYEITNRRAFDRETPQRFAFAGDGDDREQSLFVQDHVQAGPWTLSAGVRWDHYRVAVDEHALSPRLSSAWSWPDAGLVARASYDRAFQTPAIENLLLASSPDVEALSDEIVHLPVRPSRGDFYEAGLSKALGGILRVDGSFFRRVMTDAADDDLLLNTGVSFPIAFRRAAVAGAELKIDVPRWRALAASAGYTWMRGRGTFPITGGLFLGEEAAALLASTDTLPLSQDQRHTLRGRATWHMTPAAWAGAAMSYDSGLPVEFDDDRDDAVEQFGERIVSRVNFDTGRVRPSLSLDGSLGVTFARSPGRSVHLQVDVRNLTNRLNVINFAGVFSGTALGPPRTLAARLRVDF